MKKFTLKAAMLGATAMVAAPASADQVFADDLIVQGSACIGIDCNNGESFGFDTLRLKENNLRIKAQDTSTSASFPTNDWQITFNDSSNGGANKFSVDDIDNGVTPFTIEASSIANALYVSDAGDVGLGTASPVVELHAVDGNSPTLRLEQDGSSGFTPQTWDLAGNETNFFIRDVTNGSKLPFRVQPNTPDQTLFLRTGSMTINETGADFDTRIESDTKTDAFFVDGATGNVGIGSDAPLTELFIEGDATKARIRMSTTDVAEDDFLMNWKDEKFRMSLVSTPVVEFALDASGNLVISGSLTTGTAGSCTAASPCDAVFDSSIYTVPAIEDHQSAMWENKYLPAVGPTLPDQPLDVTDKLLNMLNELEHAHIYIGQLHERLSQLEAAIELNDG